MPQDLERWTGSICGACNQTHLVKGVPPSCCSTGNLFLEERERVRAGTNALTLDLTSGCRYWQADAGGCSIYPQRFERCREFPHAGSLYQLLAGIAHYPDCALLDFLWRLTTGELKTAVTTGGVNSRIDVPVFGPQESGIIENLLYCYDSGEVGKQVAALFDQAQVASHGYGGPVVSLFFLDPLYEGVLCSKPFSLADFARLEPVEGHPVVAALTYPSPQSLTNL